MADLAKALHSIFFSGMEHYALGSCEDDTVSYRPVEEKISRAVLEDHLRGDVTLGAYQIHSDNTVQWMALDVDSSDNIKEAQKLAQRICEALQNVPHTIEYSGRKGYHIFLFFDRPEPVDKVKIAGDSLRDALGLPKTGKLHVEVFPKQAGLTPEQPMGNLIKLPLGLHPKTRNRSIFVSTKTWENGPELDAEAELAKRTTLLQLQTCLDEKDPETAIAGILSEHWKDGNRHEMSLYVAGMCATADWTEEQAEELVTKICELAGDTEVKNRLQTVEDTYKKAAQGQPVAGYSGLVNLLPMNTLRNLVELIGKMTTKETVLMVDKVRLSKGATFLKIRNVAKLINSTLLQNGRIVRDDMELLWLDHVTKELWSMTSPFWFARIYDQFGINAQESFGSQVIESIRLMGLERAEPVQVHKRCYWDNDEGLLYLNLGKSEIYVLNGKTVEVTYNGESNILFRNSDDSLAIPNFLDMGVEPVDPWEYLVNDISFAVTETASASNEEQRELLKAFILSLAFSQAMPTRPILSLMGATGSGKTTTARRVLKIFEGMGEDVLGLVVDKPDSLRSSLTRHKVLVLDNLEKTKATWLSDMINRIATGSHIEIRQLYKTNEVIKIRPDCYVIATAIEMPFSEESIFTRLLPIEMETLIRPKPEYYIQQQLGKNMIGIWHGLIELYSAVVASLRTNRTIEAPVASRLADFTTFCARIKGSGTVDGRLLMSGLDSLSNRQRKILQESSPFTQALERWLEQYPSEARVKRSLTELNTVLSDVARKNYIDWHWTSAQGLGRHMSMLESQLVRYFGMEVHQPNGTGSREKRFSFTKSMVEL